MTCRLMQVRMDAGWRGKRQLLSHRSYGLPSVKWVTVPCAMEVISTAGGIGSVTASQPLVRGVEIYVWESRSGLVR